ncbi:MAG: hypothetical protein RIR45_2129 [Pseudomonadota bacterium]|jgi:competence protein ComEA
MFKKILAALALSCASWAFAALEVNQATEADLDSIKGIGPAMSTKILAARKQGEFTGWADFIARVKGMAHSNAAKFSAQGLTVNGTDLQGRAPAPPPTKD